MKPKTLRLRLKETQEQFAERFGVSVRTVQGWEMKKSRPPSGPAKAVMSLACRSGWSTPGIAAAESGVAIDVQRIAQGMGLSIISQQNLDALGRNAFRFSIGNGRSVRDVIRALEANSIVAVAQPNYQYRVSQNSNTPVAEHKGDPAQYMVEKLQLEEVHRIASGKNVTIAVIDSEADKQHTELQGQIAEQFNAVGEAEKAHSHGTAMVGAIASRDRLLGVAPGAKILAVRAFSESQQSAEGTTFNILKSIDWAVSRGAKVINMSFAGPRDPALERTLKKAYDQGVVLIAAAGNFGAKSPPQYPAADPNVIAVSATDENDKIFTASNRGNHIAVSAPGVDILMPAPNANYQVKSGTSFSAALVSGIAALILERKPQLSPDTVRQIIVSTARDIGAPGKDPEFGAGLADAYRAHDDGPRDPETLSASIHLWIERQTFTPRRGSTGVHLVDAVAARFGAFDHVHIVGLVDAEWPERQRRSIFYTSSLLKDLGWPSEIDHLKSQQAGFRDLVTLPRRTLGLSAFQLEGDAVVAATPLTEEARMLPVEQIRRDD